MAIQGFGDLASAYRSSVSNLRIKTSLSKLAEELASGQKSDLQQATNGNLTGYAGIENSLNAMAAYQTANREAALFADTLQLNFEFIQDHTIDIGPALLTAANIGLSNSIQVTAESARSKFDAVISHLNARVADRSLMAGADVTGSALASADVILTELKTAIAAETTAAGVESVVVAWFDTAAGGFETIGYTGATDDLDPFRLNASEQANMQFRADDAEIRDLLKGYAIASLVAEGALSTDHNERLDLASIAGARLASSNAEITDIRARIGTEQAKIEAAQVRNDAEISALEQVRTNILQADPYETATRLQASEIQLETLYAITARLSRLNLAGYLN